MKRKLPTQEFFLERIRIACSFRGVSLSWLINSVGSRKTIKSRFNLAMTLRVFVRICNSVRIKPEYFLNSDTSKDSIELYDSSDVDYSVSDLPVVLKFPIMETGATLREAIRYKKYQYMLSPCMVNESMHVAQIVAMSINSTNMSFEEAIAAIFPAGPKKESEECK